MSLTNAAAHATVAPRTEPKAYYPAPWCVAERRGDEVTVICADGHYACMAASIEAAAAIVAAVNAFAGVDQ